MLSDGTDPNPDVTLGDEETETPEETTYTQTQYDKAIRDARTAVLADSGRFEQGLKQANAAAERIKKQREQLLTELEEVEKSLTDGDARQLDAVSERKQRRTLQTNYDDIESENSELKERITQLEASQSRGDRDVRVKDVATRLKVDVDRLIEASQFTDGSLEALEGLAKTMTKREVRPPVETDSGGGGGSGGRTFTRQQVADMPLDEYAKNKDAIEKAQAAGKIK